MASRPPWFDLKKLSISELVHCLSSFQVGFNGGNRTGWVRLPYSGEGRVGRLALFTNGLVPGRWIYRVDEEIVAGGCSNESVGYVVVSPDSGIQVGGVAVNVSGPCLRDGDHVKVHSNLRIIKRRELKSAWTFYR